MLIIPAASKLMLIELTDLVVQFMKRSLADSRRMHGKGFVVMRARDVVM